MGSATTGLFNINEPLQQALQLDDNTELMRILAQVHKITAQEAVKFINLKN